MRSENGSTWLDVARRLARRLARRGSTWLDVWLDIGVGVARRARRGSTFGSTPGFGTRALCDPFLSCVWAIDQNWPFFRNFGTYGEILALFHGISKQSQAFGLKHSEVRPENSGHAVSEVAELTLKLVSKNCI